MARYIDADALIDKLKELKEEWGFTFTADGVEQAIFEVEEAPTADVVPKSEVAEMLRLMYNDDCACNYNGNDEWLPLKCKYAETDCPTPKDRLGCWMEFVKHGLDKFKKKYTEGENDGCKQ